MVEHILTPEGVVEFPGFSHASTGTGRLVVVSGQVPLTPDGSLVSDEPLLQARQTFANIAAVLTAAGAGVQHVVRLGLYLLDLGDTTPVIAARDEFLAGTDAMPASTLVQVAGLAIPGARMEIEALAVV